MRQLFVTMLAAGLVGGTADAATVYTNNFSAAATGFSGGTLTTAPSSEKYLALLQSSAALTLDTSAYVGQQLTLAFTLYGIGSVDGDGQYGGGPDPFRITVGPTQVFNYDFANFDGNTQNYPVVGSAALTGSAAQGTLGYTGFPGSVQDSTYNLTLAPFTVTGASTVITFFDGTNEGVGNEYYGIDNVTLTGEPNAPSAAPEPASWAMMIGGFGLVGAALRRRRTASVRFA